MRRRAVNIEWWAAEDAEKEYLPHEMDIPDSVGLQVEDIENFLSDETGFLVESYQLINVPTTINDVVKNVVISFERYYSNTDYSETLLRNLYESMGNPRYSRCNLLIVLDYISYLIDKHVDEDGCEEFFLNQHYNGKDFWADMTAEEIMECNDIPEDCKSELCNIIKNQVNQSFVFDW